MIFGAEKGFAMDAMRSALACLPLLALLLASPALAQDAATQRDRCQLFDEHGNRRPGAEPDLAIGACTALIQSGGETTRQLAIEYGSRGAAYRVERDYDRAIRDLDQAIRLDPNYTAAYLQRAGAYEAKQDYARAIEGYGQAIRLDPQLADAWNGRCWCRGIAGQLAEALADCNESLRLRPGDARTLDSRGFVYLKLKKLDLALADYDTVLAVFPKAASSLYGRSVVKRLKGDTAGADSDEAAATQIDPDIARKFRDYGVRGP